MHLLITRGIAAVLVVGLLLLSPAIVLGGALCGALFTAREIVLYLKNELLHGYPDPSANSRR